MRAFQSRSSAVVGAGTGSMFKSPNSSSSSSSAAFPSSGVVQYGNLHSSPTSSSSGIYRHHRGFTLHQCSSGINSLVAPASMSLVSQRGCGTTSSTSSSSSADTTKAVAGMAGYSDSAYNEESETFLSAIEEAMSEYEEKDDGRVEDVDYQSSVLNIQTSKGTFILNRQAPKLQLWLSSPISGPTHYDRVKGTKDDPDKVWWRCDRHGRSLEELLSKELGSVLELDGPLKFEGLE